MWVASGLGQTRAHIYSSAVQAHIVFTGWCWFLWKSPGCFPHQSFLCLEFNDTYIYLGKVVKPSIWRVCHAKISAMLIVNGPLHTGLWNARLWKSSGAWQLSLPACWVEMCPWKWQLGNQTDSAYPFPDRQCTHWVLHAWALRAAHQHSSYHKVSEHPTLHKTSLFYCDIY